MNNLQTAEEFARLVLSAVDVECDHPTVASHLTLRQLILRMRFQAYHATQSR